MHSSRKGSKAIGKDGDNLIFFIQIITRERKNFDRFCWYQYCDLILVSFVLNLWTNLKRNAERNIYLGLKGHPVIVCSSNLQTNLYIAQTKITHVCDYSVKYVFHIYLKYICQLNQMYCASSSHVVSYQIFRIN